MVNIPMGSVCSQNSHLQTFGTRCVFRRDDRQYSVLHLPTEDTTRKRPGVSVNGERGDGEFARFGFSGANHFAFTVGPRFENLLD